jgi:competence CoiA-like predicted nuclease
MLVAIRDSDNNRVIGYEIEKDSGQNYTCPCCKKQVIHHKSSSEIKIGHFKHKIKQSECANRHESKEHIEAKVGIYKYLQNEWVSSFELMELERWICNNTIRPDIYIETRKGTKIAIEVQASSLTVDEIIQRTMRYHKNNIYVFWVLIFNFSRFYEHSSYSESGFIPTNRLRLKSFELFLSELQCNKLFLWSNRDKNNGFIGTYLSEHRQEDREFRKEGTDYYYEGKPSKVLRCVDCISYNLSLKDFIPVKTKGYSCRSLGIFLPESSILVTKRRPFQNL